MQPQKQLCTTLVGTFMIVMISDQAFEKEKHLLCVSRDHWICIKTLNKSISTYLGAHFHTFGDGHVILRTYLRRSVAYIYDAFLATGENTLA